MKEGIKYENIETHYEKDERKFKSYAVFIADAYNETGEERGDMNIQATNKRIEEIYEGMKDLNVYKNTQYGNIGSEPLNLFARYMSKETPALNGIYQRLDDKLSRVKNCPDEKPRVNDVCDIIGYLNLLLVNLGVTKEDIAKFKD